MLAYPSFALLLYCKLESFTTNERERLFYYESISIHLYTSKKTEMVIPVFHLYLENYYPSVTWTVNSAVTSG
ncbi:hypothetical protein SAMN04488048_10896 [Trichococcus flocculiformis]|nr:Hypothetical protein TES5_1772 [Trichococcus sp. ES5]SHF65800.1 hypothetical protein SAMN04488048_10896 [Trichococcus flocculiformis]